MKEQPRASKCLRRCWGSIDLIDAWSFTFVSPPHAIREAVNPLELKPFKCKIVRLCRQLILASDKSPTSVTELYDKFICTSDKKQRPNKRNGVSPTR